MLDKIPLAGLAMAPPQVLGGIRLVPLLRHEVREDLRLARQKYGEDLGIVQLDRTTAYYSYIPHALVATWSNDGSPAAAFGTRLQAHKQTKKADGRVHDLGFMTARVIPRVRRRVDKNRLRFLPLHVSMEGFLALHFGGPKIAWEEYSRSALRDGLSPRAETSVPARWIVGLEDALRVFEIHSAQVGMLVFVADSLASAFVVPHPDDYRALHHTLLTDFYGELLFHYGLYATENVYHPDPIDADKVNSISDLRAALSRLRADWSELHELMTTELFDRPVRTEPVYSMGPFRMRRFITELDPKTENHIGEAILRDDGTLEYMKTYRLSAAQCRRAYLLMQLAESMWNLDVCAEKLNCTKDQLIFRMQKAGFGYLLHQHVLDAAILAKPYHVW